MEYQRIKINKTIETKNEVDAFITRNIVDLIILQKWIDEKLKDNIKYAKIHYGYDEQNNLDAYLICNKLPAIEDICSFTDEKPSSFSDTKFTPELMARRADIKTMYK